MRDTRPFGRCQIFTSQDRHRNNELCEHSLDSKHGLHYMGLKSQKWKRFFSSPKRPLRLWGPLDAGVHSSGQLDRGVMLTTYLHVARRLRKSAAISLIPQSAFMAWTRAILPLTNAV